VFDPFIQEDRLHDRAQGGLGIGLALVRSLVDLHGGRVQAFSAGRGQGSEFVLHLPVLRDAPLARSDGKPHVRSHNAPGRRILVVDDTVDTAETLATLLRVVGHEVHTAYDGPTALDAARNNRPDVVMLDIGMPRMDGLEVARRMRQEPALKDLLLVAMTGYGQDEDRRLSQAAGFNAHLVKPVDLNALRSVLDQLPEIARGESGPEQP
jgi:CheY-like chemotaxis protein